MALRVGSAVEIPISGRYYVHTRSQSVADVYDALVELITNADDSYGRLYRKGRRNKDGGDILIEYDDHRKGTRRLVVRDKAEGMDSHDMDEKLAQVGVYSSDEGSRGYMGRGAKDCTQLGDVIYESIKDNHYYRCRLTPDRHITLEVDRGRVTPELRKGLSLEKGNGTSVTLELAPQVALPRFSTLAAELPWHYALRDIMSEDSDSRVLMRRAGQKEEKPVPLVYRRPVGELVISCEIDVEDYPGVVARLRVWRAPEPLQEDKGRFERAGILIKGERAIHECSFLSEDIRGDAHSRRFFGRLECGYIDKLLGEYEERLEKGESHPQANPMLVIDATRRTGLDRRHPFAQKLLAAASEPLRALIALERQKEKAGEREMATSETRDRLSRLARAASRFMRSELDEIDGISEGDWVEGAGLAQRGMMLVPGGGSVGVGETKSFYVYVNPTLLNGHRREFAVEVGGDAVELSGGSFELVEDRREPDRLRGVFKVLGKHPSLAVGMTVSCGDLEPVHALVEVVGSQPADRVFADDLEFEREEYRVRSGHTRTLRLFARCPEVVDEEVEVTVMSSDTSRVLLKGSCTLRPVHGTNYAEGECRIEGRRLGATATMTATTGEHSAQARVRVVEKPREEGVPMQIQLVAEDFGNFRARWGDAPESHILKIAGLHPSLRRYLGEPTGNPPQFPGQSSPLYLVLLAEVVAEAVCHRLMLEAGKKPQELYELRLFDMGHSDLPEMLDTIRFEYHKRLNRFLVLAHTEMVRDAEAKWPREA